MITRQQYLAREATHREYYAQFVDDEVRAIVVNHIGIDRLMKSVDEHLNDIPLPRWDYISRVLHARIARQNGGSASLAEGVCVAKEAARQLIESHVEEPRDDE